MFDRGISFYLLIGSLFLYLLAPLGCKKSSATDDPVLNPNDCLSRAVFGDPENSEYILPFSVGESYYLWQGYCYQAGGHRNQLAYDFEMPIGRKVIAARDGVIREVKEDSPDNGQGSGKHNYILIEHVDGTIAFYAHLQQNGVLVDIGDTVTTGQHIAYSGNSGYTGTPHLHFGVYQSWPARDGYDVAVNFRNADGPLDSRGGLVMRSVYTALPY